ncbi:g7059 [Coccomyxa elongata]
MASDDPNEPQLSLHDLPDGVLDIVMSYLQPADLASLAGQARKFKELADISHVWEEQCKARWAPFCGEPDSSSDAQGPDWQSLYKTRAVLSPQVVASVDLALAYHACTKSGAPIIPGTRTDLRRAFEQSMKAAFEVGMECERKPGSRNNPLIKQLQGVLCWWLSEKQEVAVAFVRDAQRRLEEYDMWRMAFINWPDIPWRRSAIAFLPGLVRSTAKAWDHVSVLGAIETETGRLDATIKSLQSEGDSLEMQRIPDGLPRSHWWFRLD